MEEAFYYNAVAAACDGDIIKIAKFRKYCGDWERAYQMIRAASPERSDPEKDWDVLKRNTIRLILRDSPEFPRLLREITNPPFGIYIKGSLPRRAHGPMAIVGTRRATPEGKEIARCFARELATAEVPIVSGLAFGIDAAAHEGSLGTERGVTIAVLAGGLADVYPREHRPLAEKILARGGALISEYPPGSPPYASRFLERNRLISGLSRGTLIVEAPIGSGSLVTARRAMDDNRDVFVVPGSIIHSHFKGSHALIRQGAELVSEPADILEAYGITCGELSAAQEKSATPEEMLILKALRSMHGVAEVDKIIALTKLEPQIVNRSLSFLLLKGMIGEKGSGYTIKK